MATSQSQPNITLGKTLVTPDSPPYIIAEAGINHQGDINNAKLLIDLAAQSGANAVKFQKRTISRILTKEGLAAPYTSKNAFAPTYGAHKEALELTKDQFLLLQAYATEKGLDFTASGWDEEAVDFLDEINVPFFKMASADLTNFPLLIHTAKKQRPMIISTGMADQETVQAAYDLIHPINSKLAILHCCSAYPCPPENLNLRVIQTYQKLFPTTIIGYSGHESTSTPTLAAAALGAKIIERHFTFSKTAKGSDHAASLEPKELTKLISDINIIHRSLGSPTKTFQSIETACFKKLSKSLVSATEIPKGTVLTTDHLTVKGPGTGIPPTQYTAYIGATSLKDIPADTLLDPSHFDLHLPL